MSEWAWSMEPHPVAYRTFYGGPLDGVAMFLWREHDGFLPAGYEQGDMIYVLINERMEWRRISP